MSGIRSWLPVLAAITSLMLLGGCASTASTDNGDPHESMNRKFYAFNDTLDRNILEPVARGYVKVTPDPVREGVTNFFGNVSYLNTIANDLLQGKVEQFFRDSSRFVVNSTIGVGGLFDPATDLGLAQNNEDLGQTFGTWGAGEGAYLTLPFLGPSSYRDLPAPVMGIFLNPLTYLTAAVTIPVNVVNAVNARANLLDASRIRDQAALDPYTFVREAWRQQREYLIYDGNPPSDGFEDYIEGEGDAAILRVY
ncbi:MAG: VacJ family lipoprotein [Gammaproteobacteria bacterium]